MENNEILLKQSEEVVAVTRADETALNGETIPPGKYLVKTSTTLTPIKKS
jgi:hypothetical protein